MKYLLTLIASAILTSLATAAPAHASEWGCEVMLCAASSNPSWRGVESCHPPMEKLISAMKEPGFSWPTCPEGGAGEPGYEQYGECQPGWTPTAGEGGERSGLGRPEQSRCSRTVNQCHGARSTDQHDGGRGVVGNSDQVDRIYSGRDSCQFTEYVARPVRREPFYFDLKDEMTGKSNRFWFELKP